MRNPLTPAYDWLTKAVGLDDAEHHGISFTKLIIVWFAWRVGLYIKPGMSITWQLVILVIGLVCGAFGRPVMYKFLDLLKAKWTGTSTDATNVSITGDAAAMIKALPNAWRDDESGVEK